MDWHTKHSLIVIGCSAGGMDALRRLITGLPSSFRAPVLAVLHRHTSSTDFLARHLSELSGRRIVQAEDKERIQPASIYVAPPGYHLLLDDSQTLSLSTDDRVIFSRPSIDVTMESVAAEMGPVAVGVILTGANQDGAKGLAALEQVGGLAVVQDPEEAEVPEMPRAAIRATRHPVVRPIEEIAKLLAGVTADME